MIQGRFIGAVSYTHLDWTVQRSTAFHVWCVLGDGSAVCMTLNREQKGVAWHAHRLEHGRILSVASLRGSRNTPDEEVWFEMCIRDRPDVPQGAQREDER